MKYLNIGVAKQITSAKLTSEFLSEGTVKSNKLNEFVELINSSKVLSKLNNIFENVENIHIKNDELACKFIDEQITLPQTKTNEIVSELKKLKPFIDESFSEIKTERLNLLEAINTLIIETSKKRFDETYDVNTLYSAYDIVLEHIKTPKEKLVNEERNEILSESDIFYVLGEFNQKYSDLSESEIDLIKKITYSDDEDKKKLFETLKNENIDILSGLDKKGIEDKITKSLSKLDEMNYSKDNILESIVELYNFNKNLKS